MMEKESILPELQFLQGGGEMGKLTRMKDWSRTPVGSPEQWPQSLRTTLSILLHSKFPMFLWWGPELICFYNDAYRPSLGTEGKHPSILGMPAKEAWAEIWDIIYPLIKQVQTTGDATWNEDQLIPIFRNGKIEDVYWTFSYSPVMDESGNIGGVLVTCSETTEKVNTLRRLEESKERFRKNIIQAPVAMCILRGDKHTVEIVNNGMLKLMGKDLTDVLHLPVFEGNQEVRGQGLEQLVEKVYRTGETYTAFEMPLNLPRNETMEKVYLDFTLEALKEEDGSISGVVAVATDVTSKVFSRQLAQDSEKRFRETVRQAPLGITILRGKNFVAEMANETYLQIVGKTEQDFVGKPLFDSLPEVKEIVEPLLTNVLQTGEPFVATELSVTLHRYGRKELSYFNLVYHPFREENGEITGIIVVATEVSDSVRAKHSLSESEKQFRNMVTQSPIPMTIFRGPDYIIEMANARMFETIWRKQEHEIIGRKALEVFPELNDQKYPELLKQVFTTGQTYEEKESVAIVQGDDGPRKFYLDFQYAPLFETDGSISGIIITVNDVTARVETRRQVEDAEQRLRLATEATELATWELDVNSRSIIYSQRMVEIFGYSPDNQPTHAELRKHLFPDDTSIVENAFQQALKTSQYFYEARVMRNDGKVRWIRTQGQTFYDENKNPVKLIGTTRDITDEKEIQLQLIEEQRKFATVLEQQVNERTNELQQLNEELRKSEERYHLMVQEVQDYAIIYLNREGFVQNWNQGAEKIKGYRTDEIIGKHFSVFYTDSDRENKLPQVLLARAADVGKALQEGWRVRKNGILFWASVVITALHDESGNVIGFSKVTHDLTEKKEAENQLRINAELLEQKNRDLEKMNAELQSFAYVSSHDLQEPLRKIQAFSSRLLDKEVANLSEQGKDYFRRMQDAAARMQTLIEDLLTYSRTSAADGSFEKTAIGPMVDEVLNELRERITEKIAHVTVGPMPEIEIIPFQFRQLLQNLIGNALKFSRNGVPPEVKISSKLIKAGPELPMLVKGQSYCHFSIEDNGIGFASQYKDRIFEVFQRLHGREQFSGTGIGLAIVKKIVENHKGHITAIGQPNEGARFDFYIPTKRV